MNSRRELSIIAVLVLATAAVYGRLAGHEFVDFDDPGYVFNNAHVRSGLTWDGVLWAFTTDAQANWNPLTWLSHMADAQCFGVDGRVLGLPASGWHHLIGLALHVANTILLFLLLRTATRTVWRSAMVAALFALHPLHVESVAWASERKDVLSTFLGFGCLLAYVQYARRPGAWSYVLVFTLLALGLMAKPMLVTWPFVMLLMDWWPLGPCARPVPGSDPAPPKFSMLALLLPPRRLILEKLPLLALSAASCIATYWSQRAALYLTDVVPFEFRAQNALIEAFSYVVKCVWPSRLAALYPYPHTIDANMLALAAPSLIAITCIVVWCGARRPYVAFGWFWFLGTLVPVSGLIQFGLHAGADRYTYVPLVGLFVLFVWGAAELAERWRAARSALATAGALSLAFCVMASARQLAYWSDTVTLFRHTCDVTKDNGWAHRILGTALAGKGRAHDAIPEYREALRIWPGDPIAHNNLGSALEVEGGFEEALREYREAVRLDPGNATYRRNLAHAVAKSTPPRGSLDHGDGPWR